jgi:hypothetical protein
MSTHTRFKTFHVGWLGSLAACLYLGCTAAETHPPGTGGSTASGGAAAGGVAGSGGTAPATGGISEAGGSTSSGRGTGGTANGKGGAASGGSTATGGTASGGSMSGTGGTTTGGTSTTTGGRATGGTATGGTSAATGGRATGGTSMATGGAGGGGGGCGATPNPLPFNCRFAWGVNAASPSTYNYVQFISNWAGYNIKADGTISSCDQCGWLKSTMANVPQVPALIAYFIGYYGHANGLPDGNQGGPPNLTTGMGTLLLGVANAACPQGTICADNLMVKAYAWYAAQVYANYKKPVIWLMEGDFVQYSPEGSQTVPLSYDQTGQLAAQITNAIKCNDPPAIVAWNYSTWISAAQRDSYFSGINANMAKLGTSYEMVWTSGKGNTTSAGTATTWDQLYTVAGKKPIISDESFGLSVAGDTWANQTAATINARIAQHVVAADITTSSIPSYLQTNVTTTLAPTALSPIPDCP